MPRRSLTMARCRSVVRRALPVSTATRLIPSGAAPFFPRGPVEIIVYVNADLARHGEPSLTEG